MSVSTRQLPLFTAEGILERVRVFSAGAGAHSGQIAVLFALAMIQAADAEQYGPYDGVPPDERREPNVTVNTVAAYVRLSPATTKQHLDFWHGRRAIERSLKSPFPAYYIGA